MALLIISAEESGYWGFRELRGKGRTDLRHVSSWLTLSVDQTQLVVLASYWLPYQQYWVGGEGYSECGHWESRKLTNLTCASSWLIASVDQTRLGVHVSYWPPYQYHQEGGFEGYTECRHWGFRELRGQRGYWPETRFFLADSECWSNSANRPRFILAAISTSSGD